MDELNYLFKKNNSGKYLILFGKHRNELLYNVIKYDYPYVDWLLWESDFADEVKEFVGYFVDQVRKIESAKLNTI